MRLSFILPDFNGGGAQKMMINMANEFSSRDYQVDLIVFNGVGDYVDDVEQAVRVIDLGKSRALSAVMPLRHYLNGNKPDVVISALFYVNLITLLSKIFSFSKNTQFIISERNNLSLRLTEMTKLNSFILKLLVQYLYPFANNIIGISNGVCDDLKTIINSKHYYKISTIYNPVVTSDFEDKITEDVESVFLRNEDLKLITSGRFEIQKDYPTLLNALALYKKKYGSFHLVILGKGPLKEEMVKLSKELKIKDNITFLGFVDNSLAYMKQADMFVISSAWEGFCNVIVEALYAGLKIVSTDCPSGPSEILSDGEFGGLSPVGDAEALCEEIYLMSQKNISNEVQKIRSLDFTVQKKSNEFESLFAEVV